MTIRVVRDQRRPMRHEIHIGESTLTTDISAEEGGEASGPNPHDLYDAALGACMALTVLWYSKHKQFSVGVSKSPWIAMPIKNGWASIVSVRRWRLPET